MYPALTRGRHSLEAQPYLCTTVTVDRIRIFGAFWFAVAAARKLMALQKEGHGDLLAWVIMPDHVHVLMMPGRATISESMRLFKGLTARAIASGGLWQRGFHDYAMRREEDLVAAARYVVANPLRAGLVRSLRDYPFWDSAWL
jgi:REP element-mobilizing transposase RayT